MNNIEKEVKEATSSINVENTPLDKQELKIIKQALEDNKESFIKTLYEGMKNAKDKRK